MRCFSNLWPPLSQKEFKSTSVFLLEVVLPIQKHSGDWIKVCNCHCFRIKYSEPFRYNCRTPSEFSNFHGKVIKPRTPSEGVLWKTWPENFQSLELMLNMTFVTDGFLVISLKLTLKFSEQLCQEAIIFSCSGYSWRNGWVTQGLNGK